MSSYLTFLIIVVAAFPAIAPGTCEVHQFGKLCNLILHLDRYALSPFLPHRFHRRLLPLGPRIFAIILGAGLPRNPGFLGLEGAQFYQIILDIPKATQLFCFCRRIDLIFWAFFRAPL